MGITSLQVNEPLSPFLKVQAGTYDKRCKLTRTELNALEPFLRPRKVQANIYWSPNNCPEIRRLLLPLFDVLEVPAESAGASNKYLAKRTAIRLILREMYHRKNSFWAWQTKDWAEVACKNTETFNSCHTCAQSSRTTFIDAAYLLGEFTDFHLIGGIHYHRLARRVFGQKAVEMLTQRVHNQLRTWGYGESSMIDVTSSLCEIIILNKSPRLEDITLNLLITLRKQACGGKHNRDPEAPQSALRKKIYVISRVLTSFGIIPEPLSLDPKWNRSRVDVALINVSPEWASWCKRWKDTSVLEPSGRKMVYYGALTAGRWLNQTHPEITSPAQWTKELAIDYVAAVDRAVVGQWTSRTYIHCHKNVGKPLRPSTKCRYICEMRTFLRDCQEWEWIPRRFDPTRTLSTPTSIGKLVEPNPRIIEEDIWAQLLDAGLNLTAEDLPKQQFTSGQRKAQLQYWYPLEMVRALAIVWLFAGLRRNEIIRLRIGCIRWQREAISIPGTDEILPKDAVCLLEIPTSKTCPSFIKPVDIVVGEAIREWERVRYETPLMKDPKTQEMVQYLFAHRVKRVGKEFINNVLIPLLCRKAGVPEVDAKGNITSHRARSTIASQLANAKEPMTLLELKDWLGHRRLETTLHYIYVTQAKLAKSYQDADYYSRNLRKLNTLLDNGDNNDGNIVDVETALAELLKTRETLIRLQQSRKQNKDQVTMIDQAITILGDVYAEISQ
jgi:integrase